VRNNEKNKEPFLTKFLKKAAEDIILPDKESEQKDGDLRRIRDIGEKT